MIFLKKILHKAQKKLHLPSSIDKKLLIITSLLSFLVSLNYFFIHVYFFALFGIFIHIWVILAKLKIGDFSLTALKKNTSKQWNINFSIIVINFFGLAGSLSVILPRNLNHAGDSSQLLSLAGIILAIVTGYYLWTLDRTESAGKKMILNLKEKFQEIEKIEKALSQEERKSKEFFIFYNTFNYLFTLLLDIQGATLQAIDDKDTNSLENKKKALIEISQISNFCLAINQINKKDISGIKIKALELTYKGSIRSFLNPENKDLLIQIEEIKPLLTVAKNYLLNIKNNEHAKKLAKLIDQDLKEFKIKSTG